MDLRILFEAESEIRAAAEWYESRQPGLAEDFFAELTSVFESIAEDPERFPELESSRTILEYRRCILRRFPYVVVFEVTPDEVIVHAVSHGRRRPNYWKRRRS